MSPLCALVTLDVTNIFRIINTDSSKVVAR